MVPGPTAVTEKVAGPPSFTVVFAGGTKTAGTEFGSTTPSSSTSPICSMSDAALVVAKLNRYFV